MSVLAVESLYVCKKPLYVLSSLSVSLSNLLVQLFSGNCVLPLATSEAPEVGIFLAFLERLSPSDLNVLLLPNHLDILQYSVS